MNEWKEYKLKELCSKIGSGATPSGGSNAYKVEGISLIRSQNILDFTFSYDGLAFIDEEQAEKLKNVILKPDDILLNITGDSVARVCKVPLEVLPARVNQHVSIIRPDEDKLDNSFLLYYLQYIKPHLLSISEIGGTRNAITKVMIENLDIPVPELRTQYSIASILSSLDDKIALLHRQNATLEALAETLFRQWFVEEAEESWENGRLGDLINVRYGKDHKNLQEGSIPVYGSGGVMRYADKALYAQESVLIPRKGTLSNVLYIDEPFWTVDTMFYTEMRQPNLAKFIFHFVKKKDLASMNVGSAVPSMTTEILNNLPINIPPLEKLEQFEWSVEPMYNKTKSNQIQIRTLTQLRDTLLPKLMSGEVRVSET